MKRTLSMQLTVWIAATAGHSVSAAEMREQEVTFRSGSIALAGTLVFPAASGPRPAVVLVHGSGDGPREPLRNFARRFAADGAVALIYDKRGSGKSGGSWVRASLDELAGDVLAAARFLKGRPEVDARRVGAWAISQGGWVLPRAAVLEPDALAFAIVVTGGALRPSDVEHHDAATRLDAAQVGPDEKRRGLEEFDRYVEYLGTGRDRPGLEALLRERAGEPSGRVLHLEKVLPPADGWIKWTWVATYDPAPDVARLRMPVLVVLGSQDRPALAVQARARWVEGLAGNRDATVVELLGAGHGATVAGTHHHGGEQTFVAGYLELVDAWFRAHLP